MAILNVISINIGTNKLKNENSITYHKLRTANISPVSEKKTLQLQFFRLPSFNVCKRSVPIGFDSASERIEKSI